MKVEAQGALIENGEMLIGPLDMGGYFPVDATIYPEASGTLELVITIEYTDDFNQPRTITKTLTVQVEEYLEPVPDPSDPGMGEISDETQETFWQKLWRFILGIFGLDSGVSTEPSNPEIPLEPIPVEPIPAPANNGKG
jgi:hypothetical protein